ncbi:MAG: hypothetical protein H0X39_16465 [Actinobacteria bacterium]|nr:hypothetical protein [Actinomycetota bacterium]
MALLFTSALFVGTGTIGAWIHLRVRRVAAAPVLAALIVSGISTELLSVAPIRTGSYSAIYTTVFAELFPLLVILWLSLISLLGAARGASR